MKDSINRRDAIKKTAMLMGYAVSASAIASVMSGCKADPKVVADGLENWNPEVLSNSEGQLVAQIAERIIPKTDSPGAIDVGVHSFVDNFLKLNVETGDQTGFKESLANFEASCKSTLNKSFLDCTKKEQIEFLKQEEAEAIKKAEDNPEERTFWFSIKELTFLGYFSSEAGAKEFLRFDPIPGGYEACIPLEEVGGTWYTV